MTVNKINMYYMLCVCVCVFLPVAVINPSLAFNITSKLHNLCTQGTRDVFEIGREHSSSHKLQHKRFDAFPVHSFSKVNLLC